MHKKTQNSFKHKVGSKNKINLLMAIAITVGALTGCATVSDKQNYTFKTGTLEFGVLGCALVQSKWTNTTATSQKSIDIPILMLDKNNQTVFSGHIYCSATVAGGTSPCNMSGSVRNSASSFACSNWSKVKVGEN